MNIYEEFVGIVTTLQAAKIDFAVCGGFAMAIHGLPRYTKDIDLLVRPEDVERVVRAVRVRDFIFDAGTMRFGEATPREQDVRRINKIVDRDLLTLDLLIVGRNLEGVWLGKEVYNWNDFDVCTVSALGLARMKRAAGRLQDLADIERLGIDPNDPAIQPQ